MSVAHIWATRVAGSSAYSIVTHHSACASIVRTNSELISMKNTKVPRLGSYVAKNLNNGVVVPASGKPSTAFICAIHPSTAG